MLTDLLTSATEAMCRGCFLDPAGHIAPECCGINSVQALLLLFGVLGLISRISFFRLILLMMMTVFAAVFQNFIRVAILIIAQNILSDAAWNILHLTIGYVTAFTAMFFVLKVFNKLNNRKG